jgi:2,3-bisphosphoglycerate-independent phosphoglycerate mutase
VRYYQGRAAIEATSMGIPIDDGEAVFRCNLVTVLDGVMRSHSAGLITTGEAGRLVADLNRSLGGDGVRIYPGVSYRNICKLKGRGETLQAACTPPHDIPDRPIEGHLPSGPGSGFLLDLMRASEKVLAGHQVNRARMEAGKEPATMLWPFWGSGPPAPMPAFREMRGFAAAMTSGVDLLNGLARMAGIDVLDIPGVSDGLGNDYAAQAAGALAALEGHDMVVVHVEAPDEAAHAGSVSEKVAAIERIDSEMVARLRAWQGGDLRVLVMPDHPTPLTTRTHNGDPVPFLIWGADVSAYGARRFTEAEAAATGLSVDPGFTIMDRLLQR